MFRIINAYRSTNANMGNSRRMENATASAIKVFISMKVTACLESVMKAFSLTDLEDASEAIIILIILDKMCVPTLSIGWMEDVFRNAE